MPSRLGAETGVIRHCIFTHIVCFWCESISIHSCIAFIELYLIEFIYSSLQLSLQLRAGNFCTALATTFLGTTMSNIHVNITGFVPYDPDESYFPGATQPSPPAVAKALNVYKDELVRPIAFDLGSKGDSRSALRELCQKAVLDISPTPETALLQSSILTERSGVVAGDTSATATGQITNASGTPSLAQLAESSAGAFDRGSFKLRPVRAPLVYSGECCSYPCVFSVRKAYIASSCHL